MLRCTLPCWAALCVTFKHVWHMWPLALLVCGTTTPHLNASGLITYLPLPPHVLHCLPIQYYSYLDDHSTLYTVFPRSSVRNLHWLPRRPRVACPHTSKIILPRSLFQNKRSPPCCISCAGKRLASGFCACATDARGGASEHQTAGAMADNPRMEPGG